jgi:hypothetical protein
MQANKDLLSSSEHLSVPCFELEPTSSSLTNQLSHSLFVLTALCSPRPCSAVSARYNEFSKTIDNQQIVYPTVEQIYRVVSRIQICFA